MVDFTPSQAKRTSHSTVYFSPSRGMASKRGLSPQDWTSPAEVANPLMMIGGQPYAGRDKYHGCNADPRGLARYPLNLLHEIISFEIFSSGISWENMHPRHIRSQLDTGANEPKVRRILVDMDVVKALLCQC
ncbi:hypothetical protein KC336_g74 [Hortaea werneckii]|nr:hypothetical protein KC336_g74 [Hortaea werneckii]